jgi:hypothetical protein
MILATKAQNDVLASWRRQVSIPYLPGLFGLAFVGLPVGSVMFLPSGLVAGPCEPDSGSV